jgi:hypothetical protein
VQELQVTTRKRRGQQPQSWPLQLRHGLPLASSNTLSKSYQHLLMKRYCQP